MKKGGDMNAQSSVAQIYGFDERRFAAEENERPETAPELLAEITRLRTQVSELTAALNKGKVSPIAGSMPARSHARLIKNVIDARNRRGAFLSPELFADPAWDILLDLFLAHQSQLKISVSSLCVASNVPSSTALRWVRTLEDQGLVERVADPLDDRRHSIALTQRGIDALAGYFSTLPSPPPVL